MTTQLAQTHETYRAAFEQVQRDGPDPVSQLRSRAFARFIESGFPTTRLEPWRFTSVGPIAQRRFSLASSGRVDASALRPYDLADVGGLRIVCVNGCFSAGLSALSDLPAGLEVHGLAHVLATDPASVEGHLAHYARYDTAAASFAALNTSLIRDGVVIRVPKRLVVDRPIHVLFVTTGAAGVEAPMTHPRLLVLAGEQSQVRVIETYAGVLDGPYLTNAVTEVVLGDQAVVDHYKLGRESVHAYHIGAMQVAMGRGANFSSHSVTLGGTIVRNEVMADMHGEGGECTLNGLYLVNGRRLVDNHTTIHHASPHCDSHELYKGILDDQSRAVFNGKIVVAIDAQKTDAKQTNKALLLSEDAQINTKPELEIFADDVRCTHGATIGQLDDDAFFYLRSRGLSSEQARNVLIHAFASDLLNRIPATSVRAQLDAILLDRLPGTEHTMFLVS